MKRIYTIVLCLLTYTSSSRAQDLNIYELSGTSGVFAAMGNPAMLADSRMRWNFNLANINSRYSPKGFQNGFTPFSSLNLKLNDENNRMAQSSYVGPSFMYQLPAGNSFAISTNYRTGQFVDGTFEKLFNDDFITTDNFLGNINSAAVNELILSYAHPYVYKQHMIKGGVSLKLMSVYQANNIDGNFTKNVNLMTGSATGVSTGFQENFSWSKALLGGGDGTGLNIGFVYEFRPKYLQYEYTTDGKKKYEPSENKHLVRIGFSVNDIGKLESPINKISTNIKDKVINASLFSDGLQIGLGHLNIEAETGNDGKLLRRLPTQTSVFGELKLGVKGWNLGFLYRNSPKYNDLPIAKQSIVAFYPRYESKGLEFAVPAIKNNLTGKWNLGLHFRLGGLMFGTESLNMFFGKERAIPTIYAGINLFKIAKRRSDRDGDNVSDKQDACIDTPGLWAFKGCPDSDGDGIMDSEDRCPDHAGPLETQGCPDTDADGVYDSNDSCPEIAGLARFNGCPDTDGDGLPDDEDECPQKAGPEEFGGCPDTDGDGLIDAEDACPKIAGNKLFQGCPDSDGDGIADPDDACPTIKGTLTFNGCPDSDGDGIIDQNDKCPEVAGLKVFGGCPDSDGDGIIDTEDSCPELVGKIENKGCPDSDNDDIIDKEDSCPNEAGLVLLNGCTIFIEQKFEADSLIKIPLLELKEGLENIELNASLLEKLRQLNVAESYSYTISIQGPQSKIVNELLADKLIYAGFKVEITDEKPGNNKITISKNEK